MIPWWVQNTFRHGQDLELNCTVESRVSAVLDKALTTAVNPELPHFRRQVRSQGLRGLAGLPAQWALVLESHSRISSLYSSVSNNAKDCHYICYQKDQ